MCNAEGELRVRSTLEDLDSRAEVYVCEALDRPHVAFVDGVGIWEDEAERGIAKELCLRLGKEVSMTKPLGYRHQGLLVVLPENCPNNSLPILHGRRKGEVSWRPLFERRTN